MNNKRKKVLFLITKSSWGGAQRYVYDLATTLDKKNYECVVAVGGDGPLCNKLQEAGIRTANVEGLQRNVSLIKEIRAFWNIALCIRAEHPDVFHINSSKAGIIGALLGRALFVPCVIFTAHGWAFNEDRSFLSKKIIKTIHYLTVLLSHTTIAVSHMVKEQMSLPFAHKKITVVHNGRKISKMHNRDTARDKLIERHSALSTYKEDFWSVTIGELHPIKQHDITIKALVEVTKTHPNIRHIIISDGEERMTLEKLVTKLHLDNNIFFTGALDEAPQYLKAFDLFILSSSSEALAYAVIEACMAGLPMIISNVGGLPEIITDKEEGVLLPSGDISMLRDAYIELLTNSLLREKYSNAAQTRAKYFTLERMLTDTENIYTKINSYM